MSWLRKPLYTILIIIGLGMILPQNFRMPVEGATSADHNKDSFWYHPWGRSGTHKGVDIFAREGTDVVSSTNGIVLFKGYNGMGGNFVVVLGPKWRFHYYAHLKEVKIDRFSFVASGTRIGTVGTTGNAAGKPAHLHYTIATALPYPWRIDADPQGWKKMFYLDPTPYLATR